MKNYRIRVTTTDGRFTSWCERSKENPSIIQERVYNQLCGLNIKQVDVLLSV